MDKRFEKLLIICMLCAAVALPLLYNADSYAQVEDGLIGPDGMINEYPGILRLHIVANSDSDEDQQVKLQVRNYILAKVQNELTDKEEARTYALKNLPQIEEWARQALESFGFDYGARAQVSIRHIPAKYYDDLFFPEGNYEALTVTLGEGKGQNWWCVVFPPLCLVDNTVAVDDDQIIAGADGEEEVLMLKSRIGEILEAADEDFVSAVAIEDVISSHLNINIEDFKKLSQ